MYCLHVDASNAQIDFPVMVLIKGSTTMGVMKQSQEIDCHQAVCDADPTAVPQLVRMAEAENTYAIVWEAGINLTANGSTLRYLIQCYPSPLKLFDRVCTLLEALYAACVIHGDIKPSNFILRLNGTLALIDFSGSSKALMTPHGDVIQCEAQSICAVTETYAAPELLRMQQLIHTADATSPTTVTNSVDVYSAGKTLHAWLNVLRYNANEVASLMPIIMKMITYEPENRVTVYQLRALINDAMESNYISLS